MSKKDFNKIKTLVKKCALNPFDYPSYIEILYNNSIRHFLREQPLDLVELTFQQKPQYLPKLIEVLIEMKRLQDAAYIATKYEVSDFSDLHNEKYMNRKNSL